MRGFSRVLAYPQVLKCQQATGVQRHQHFAPFHDVQSEGPGTEDDPLRLHPKRQHHPVLILRQDRQAERERGGGGVKQWVWFGEKSSQCRKCKERPVIVVNSEMLTVKHWNYFLSFNLSTNIFRFFSP